PPPGRQVSARSLPGDGALVGTVRQLQAEGRVVLLVSRQPQALASADCGVGVDGPDGLVPWGAHVLVGDDLESAALLIDAVDAARTVSRRGVLLAEAGTAVGSVSAATRPGTGASRRAALAVDVAAALSLVQGAWEASELTRRPISPPVSAVPWHLLPAGKVLSLLDSGAEGLATRQARARRRADSQVNPEPTGLLRSFAEELANPLTPILAGGAALSAAIGSVVDAGVVAGASAFGAVVGAVQRTLTDRAVADLLARSAVVASVRRDGGLVRLPADQLVPGDVVSLVPGDVVPADARLLSAAELELDESSLTGESFPVAKSVAPVVASAVADRTSMVYEGTTVAGGRGTAVVVATGAGTEAGRSMATSLQAPPASGVETRLAQITHTTLPIALGSGAAVIAAGLLRGRPIRTSVGTGVGLAVASVPEGLPFLVGAAQLAAARRLSRRAALVRNARTIEALGRVDVLCFDKTGTLTQGRIQLARISDGTASAAVGALSARQRDVVAAGLRATPVPPPGRRLPHLTDRAVRDGAGQLGIDERYGAPEWARGGQLPFEPSRGYHATLGKPLSSNGSGPRSGESAPGLLLSVKGAPEIVLARCTGRRTASGADEPLTSRQRRALREELDRLTRNGFRVLAVAEGPPGGPPLPLAGAGAGAGGVAGPGPSGARPPEPGAAETVAPEVDAPEVDAAEPDGAEVEFGDDSVAGLSFVGFLALADPVRGTAETSLEELRAAGAQVVMITGDHPRTAEAIADELGILNGHRVVTGGEIDDLDDDALTALVPKIAVVARGTPAHKVRVVKAFQRAGRVVAMTGDGANDAPAIRLADVGIALGQRGTPAARAAADLVVTDDRLETIIAALVEGRAMWRSVREGLAILVGGNLGEIGFTVLGAGLTGVSPLSARQLLLVNLLTDLAPALAIALRRPTGTTATDLLTEGPESSLGTALTSEVALRAATTTLGATAGWVAARLTGTGPRARTVALASLVGTQLGQTLQVGRTSPTVVAASIGSAAALVGVVQTPVLSQFFGCTPLGPLGWGIATTAATGATLAGAVLPSLSVYLPEGLRSAQQWEAYLQPERLGRLLREGLPAEVRARLIPE
ncbi:MAG TPA: HAD-IC family P-type ATPase, partial [Kineosporiaceae bacterium]|nr:HAD-IC family P-type ATPase [Kineosporiaceae bacterium]